MSVPAVVIAAPSSGSGKTTVATGLMGALRQAGHRVAPFKVGPDFIDPGYHALAAGRPGRNLDPVLVGDHLIGPLYRHGCGDADIAVVEGVMGLFDGRIQEGATAVGAAPGSTAHVAALLRAPVLLVVDARGQSHSVAALVQGFSTFDDATRIAGVILNRVGSARHEDVLRDACEHAGVPVLGAIPRAAELSVPSRHLGLVPAVEHGRHARAAVDAMTDLVARHVDLAGIVAAAGGRVQDAPWDPAVAVGGPAHGSHSPSLRSPRSDSPSLRSPRSDSPSLRSPRETIVALAAGKAFSFGYTEHGELLRAAGARVVEFDPLTDPLPAGADALVLPGGFPEQFAAELSANTAARQQIKVLAEHAPVQAECAGLTYLVADLDGHPMCAVLSGSAHFTDRLTLGYRDAVAVADSSLYTAGQRVVGHEFHRTTVTLTPGPGSDDPAWIFRTYGGRTVRDGAVRAAVHAGYLHTHPAAQPSAIARFVARAAASKLGVKIGDG
jgi:cobyrinic acid a,c-diamide synthase